MPTLLPHDQGAKTHIKTHVKTITQNCSPDWVGLTAVMAGILGLALAAIIFVVDGDRFIVSYVMFVTAAIVALILRWDVEPHRFD